jgi:predicted lipid-binding transport protein (Tim44 family)
MNSRPRLFVSIPYWVLVVGSAASLAFGVWLTVDKIEVMSAGLLDGTATGVEVYGGQSWAVFAAAFVGAGLVGFVAALALAAARSLVAPAAPATTVPAASYAAAPTSVAPAAQYEAPVAQYEDADVETPSHAAPPAAAASAASDEQVTGDQRPDPTR